MLLLGVGLSMDAFAVSICKGLSMKKVRYGYGLTIAATFGIFQAIMPVIGWALASQFAEYIKDYDHWIAFVLLGGLGVKMIRDSFSDEGNFCTPAGDISVKELVLLGIATSIDAMAVGISLAFLQISILSPVLVIGFTTFIISFLGVALGNFFGHKLEKNAVLIGGIILILVGIKILIEHLSS